MYSWFTETLRLGTLSRRADLDERSTVVLLFGRFVDEAGSGLLIVLMPTLQRRVGLSVQQVGWCFQVLFGTAALVEPITGAAIDLVRRRPLLVFGGVGWAAALLVAAGASSYGWLLAAFALVGVATGPLTQTCDVVLVEAHPDAVERITSRSGVIDTVGALLAPVAVAVTAWLGADERWLLAGTGVATAAYVALLASTQLPAPSRRGEPGRAVRRMHGNVVDVLRDRRARPWLAALLLHELLDLPDLFEPVWLSGVVGVSQSLIAVHTTVGLAATIVSLVVLDRWLERADAAHVLTRCCLASLVVYPAWLFVPGYAAKLILVVPRNAVLAPLWPILRSRALASVPGRAGTVSAITSLMGLVPLAAAFGWSAERMGLTMTMAAVTLTGCAGVGSLARRLRPVADAP